MMASMRPRRVRLGCSSVIVILPVNQIGFNEAEARAPRMRPLLAHAGRLFRRFNEAEARAPRMQRSAWAIQ